MKKRSIYFTSIVVTVLLFSSSLVAATLPRNQSFPGGVAVVALTDLGQPQPSVTYLDKKVMVRPNGKQWEAVVGIPLSARPGIQKL
ncbi:MAG: hypothetical protein PVJ10_06745, partial [Thiohalophilus sp.]